MELAGVLRRVERRLKELGISADAASKRAGKADAIRNLRRAVREGRKRKGVSTSTIDALASALETTPAWLIEAKGPHAVGPNDDNPQPSVRLVGYVGAGAEAHYYAVAQGDLDNVDAPEGSTADTVAVEIRGESLGPLFDHWLVYYDEVRRPVSSDLIGALCVVGLADDRILIKKLRPGTKKGRYRLTSTPPEPPIENADVQWAAKVKRMAPR